MEFVSIFKRLQVNEGRVIENRFQTDITRDTKHGIDIFIPRLLNYWLENTSILKDCSQSTNVSGKDDLFDAVISVKCSKSLRKV